MANQLETIAKPFTLKILARRLIEQRAKMIRSLSTAALIVLLSGGALAQNYETPPWVSASRCSDRDAMEAEEGAGSLKDWRAVYRAFKRYGKCDDGGIAEGYSDAVVQLLAFHWSSIGELSRLEQKDPIFGRFVISHIDETADGDQEKAIEAFARGHCPAGLEKLCKRIEKAATFPR